LRSSEEDDYQTSGIGRGRVNGFRMNKGIAVMASREIATQIREYVMHG
jgi:hypothetical protein